MSESDRDQTTDTRLGYAIRVNGTLGETILEAFTELESVFEDGDTVLIGQLEDQPALHGVLAQIEALGLELVDIRRTTPASVDPAANPPDASPSLGDCKVPQPA